MDNAMPYKMTVAGLSDVGRKREKNEDSYIIDEPLGLVMVADGMGGHSGGEIASGMAVDIVHELLQQFNTDPEMTLPGLSSRIGLSDFGARLNYAVRTAGQKIFAKASSDPALKGMGTTAVALLLAANKVYLSNVGDSRAYLLRNAELKQVTMDHSFVGEQLRAGIISPEIARTHRMRNVITRSVGFQAEVESDIIEKTIKVGDTYLLCSDGLSNMITDPELEMILANNPPSDAARRLIDVANAHGGEDNITALVVHFDADPKAKTPKKTRNIGSEAAEDETTIEL